MVNVLRIISLFAVANSIVESFNVSLLLDVLKLTERRHNLSNVPVFVSNTTETTSIDIISFTLHKDLNKSLYIFTEKYSEEGRDTILRHHINDNTLSIVICFSTESRIWEILDKRLRKLRKSKLIVVYINDTRNYSTIQELFEKVWKLQFLQALLITNNEVYTYKPYPKVHFSQRNALQADLFPPISTDLQGYVVSTVVENDIPRIFCINNHPSDLKIRGFAYQIFQHFLRRLNATLHITNMNATRSITNSVNMSHILQMVGAGELEISIHPYTGINEEDGILGYPVFKAENCLIVPVRNEIPRYMYILRPFEWQAWLLLLIAVFYITFILFWIDPVPVSRNLLYSILMRNFLESIRQILFYPSTTFAHVPNLQYLVIYILLSAMGFFVTTWYHDLLGSYLTTFLVGKQVDSFEDLIAAQFPILAKYYEIKFLLQQVPASLVEKVRPLIVSANASEQVAHLLSFNTSFSYPITEERWTFLKLQQQYAMRPIYRWSRICFGMPRVGYPMRLDSHLEHPMTDFIMDVQSAGLDHYWLTADFKDALHAGYVRLVNNSLALKALDLSSLRVAWVVILTGWIVSLFAFIVEQILVKSN